MQLSRRKRLSQEVYGQTHKKRGILGENPRQITDNGRRKKKVLNILILKSDKLLDDVSYAISINVKF